jgi:hypothetical protein
VVLVERSAAWRWRACGVFTSPATVARLRRLGVTVVDEPPGRLAPRLADAYLDVKATGRL